MSPFADLWPLPSPGGLDPFRNPMFAAQRETETALATIYRERTFVVAALARAMMCCRVDSGLAVPAWLARHVGPWEDDWRWIVCIDLGDSTGTAGHIGVVTWHIHDSELTLFRFLNQRTAPDYEYDGHDTSEKYRRVWQYVTGQRE